MIVDRPGDAVDPAVPELSGVEVDEYVAGVNFRRSRVCRSHAT